MNAIRHRYFRLPAAGLLLVLLLGGCGGPKAAAPAADENPAIAVGNTFFDLVMHGRVAEAYGQCMSPSLQYNPRTSPVQFAADMQAVRDAYGKISKAVFDSYQLVPGKRVVQLYYRVHHEQAGDILYHLVVEADAKNRYTIFVVDIGNGQPYPPGAAAPQPRLTKEAPIEIHAE